MTVDTIKKTFGVKLGIVAVWGLVACIASFVVAAILESAVIVGITLLVLLVDLFILCITEGEVQSYSWDKRRERWAKGGYDPAYPKDENKRKEIYERDYKEN